MCSVTLLASSIILLLSLEEHRNSSFIALPQCFHLSLSSYPHRAISVSSVTAQWPWAQRKCVTCGCREESAGGRSAPSDTPSQR